MIAPGWQMGNPVIETDNEPSQSPAILGEHWSFRNMISQEVLPVRWTCITLTLSTSSSFSPTFIHSPTISCHSLINPVHFIVSDCLCLVSEDKWAAGTGFYKVGTRLRNAWGFPETQNLKAFQKSR